MADSPFNCCPALALALERQHPSIGLVQATRITFSTGATSPALAIQFRRGRKGDRSYPRKFEDGSRHADVTYGFVKFCPILRSEGLPPMSAADRPGIGSEADQSARLDHAEERHGFEILPCPKCGGRVGGCKACDDDDGFVFRLGDLTPCGPDCPLKVLIPS